MNRYLLPVTILIILLGSFEAVGQLPLMPVRSKVVKLNQPSKPGAVPNQAPANGVIIETPKLVPLAPTAAGIARYGDVQNNPNSGQINPSIPLYEIKLNDFSLPINLSYTSNGFKMNDAPGWVGMGWSINAVGTISRQVRSIPDEVTYGYNGYFPTALVASAIANGIYPNPGFQGMSRDQFLTQCGQFNFDLEPDMFFFNFGAYNGRFTFGADQTSNSTKTATLIPMSDLKITGQFENSNSNSYNTANQQGTIDNFTATDPQGVRYEFTRTDGQSEHNLDDGLPRSVCRYNTWYLTHIFTPNGNKIEFTYSPRKITNPATISQRALIPLYLPQGAQSTNFLKSPQSDQAEVIDMVLTQILVNDGKDGQIQFTEQSNTRADWNFSDQRQNAKPHALDKMTVRNGKGNIIHEYSFEYASTSRLMLRSVTERNGTSTLPPHTFTYLNETSLPAYVSPGANFFSEDYWGFYNQCSTDCDKFVPAYVYQTQPTAAVNITGSNKQPSLTGSSTGQLSQISYPTGGSTSFEYELNDYVAPATNTNICNGPYSLIGTALADLATDYSEYHEGALKEVLITIPEGVNLQNVCLQVSYRIAIGGNPSNGVFGRVGLYNSSGQAVFEPIPLRASINDLNFTSKTIIARANLTQQLRLVAEIYPDNSLDVPNLVNNQAEITVSMNQVAAGTMVTRNAGGVRIKRIKTCPNQISSVGCQLKTFTYIDNTGQSSGRLLSDLFFTTQAMKTLDAVGGGIPTVPITVLASTSPIAIVTSSGNHVYYEQISIQETDVNQTSNGGTRHQYISAALNSDIVFSVNNDQGYISFSPTISQDWRRGKPISASVVSAAGANLQETKSNYADKSYTYTGPAALKLGVDRYDKDDQPVDYIGFGYGLFTGFHYQNESTSKDIFYNAGNSSSSETQLTQTTSYSYNSPSHFFLTNTSTQNSNGETIGTRLFYPGDLTSDTELGASATGLLGVNKKSSVLKTETRTDDRLTTTQKTFYNSFSGKILPSKTIQLFSTSTDGSSIEYKGYDGKGNLQEFTKNNGYPTTYLWGYNSSYPVAEVKNATYADVVSKRENLTQLTEITTTDVSITNLVASLRQKLPNALVQGYTYDLGYGVSSTTDPSGLASYYVYDSFGRLLTIKNDKQEIVKEYNYNYRDPDASTGSSTDGNQSPYSSGTISDQLATLNQAYTYTITVSLFTDPESQNMIYTVTGLPNGLSFANNVINGTPSALGQSQVTLTATDPGGLSSSISFFLTVGSCLVADPYIVTGTYSSSTPVSFNAVNRIETDAVQQVLVNPSASLTLKAGQSVRLKPGFIIKPGASFRAYTGPCN